jgi:hypothetical protein
MMPADEEEGEEPKEIARNQQKERKPGNTTKAKTKSTAFMKKRTWYFLPGFA